jgi:uncharacterized protein with von Willebrand factor type A (vWA) domain
MRDEVTTRADISDSVERFKELRLKDSSIPGGTLLDVLEGFVEELRAAGLPVSMTENLDAMRALAHVPIIDRGAFRAALAATLVKDASHFAVFDVVFDVYFALRGAEVLDTSDGSSAASGAAPGVALPGEGQRGSGGGDAEMGEELAQALMDALMAGDRELLRQIAAQAVARLSGMEPGRPVGGTYYLYRTMRRLGAEQLLERLMERAKDDNLVEDELLNERLLREHYQRELDEVRALIEQEIRRQLVADRGPEALAKTLRKPLPEDVDFMHASREEMRNIQRAVFPLTRALAARLAYRRKRRHRGPLDFRRTVRHSLAYGGVPLEPKFKPPHPRKPEIIVIADISGSVASFARFTLQLVYAMSAQFSRVRSFAFIDGIDEVTNIFEHSDDLVDAMRRINAESDVVWVDGHSDYGHAFEQFHNTYGTQITRKSSVLILGDARNNYHATQAWVIKDLQRRARHVYWLNPEPRSYWNSGDSVMSEYAQYCDSAYECRNLRQLEHFVSSVMLND